MLSDACFTDDIKLLICGTPKNIIDVKQILLDFKKLTGLETNTQKTTVLALNCPALLQQIIKDIGYQPVAQATILGFQVSTVSDMNTLNYNKIVLKIAKQITLWNKLYLTLPGRITIAKTFMLS